jgi:hypothetical protein
MFRRFPRRKQSQVLLWTAKFVRCFKEFGIAIGIDTEIYSTQANHLRAKGRGLLSGVSGELVTGFAFTVNRLKNRA